MEGNPIPVEAGHILGKKLQLGANRGSRTMMMSNVQRDHERSTVQRTSICVCYPFDYVIGTISSLIL